MDLPEIDDSFFSDIPWNFHEREENQFAFFDQADVEQFIYSAHEHELLVIVRIGPYIGVDWSLVSQYLFPVPS